MPDCKKFKKKNGGQGRAKKTDPCATCEVIWAHHYPRQKTEERVKKGRTRLSNDYYVQFIGRNFVINITKCRSGFEHRLGSYTLYIEQPLPKSSELFSMRLVQDLVSKDKPSPEIRFPPRDPGKLIETDQVIEVSLVSQLLRKSRLNLAKSPAIAFKLKELSNKVEPPKEKIPVEEKSADKEPEKSEIKVPPVAKPAEPKPVIEPKELPSIVIKPAPKPKPKVTSGVTPTGASGLLALLDDDSTVDDW